jgi:triosephosphate isomerase
MNDRRPMIAGNWKMNLDLGESVRLVRALVEGIAGMADVDVLVAPPFTALPTVKQALGEAGIYLGAQNMHWEDNGAFTGEVSPGMLVEVGCTHVILGHSERRSLFRESDDMIDRKAEAAVRVGLIPIVCIGETLEEREQGRTFEVVGAQLEGSLKGFRTDKTMPPSTILAYEPVWAIGTGRTATPDQAQEVHRFIRRRLAESFDAALSERMRILYGGSVKPENVDELMAMPDIDGALVGGASLKAQSFLPIVRFKRV